MPRKKKKQPLTLDDRLEAAVDRGFATAFSDQLWAEVEREVSAGCAQRANVRAAIRRAIAKRLNAQPGD